MLWLNPECLGPTHLVLVSLTSVASSWKTCSGGRDRLGPSSISHSALLTSFLAKLVRPLALKESADQVRGASGGRAIDFLCPAFWPWRIVCVAVVIVKKDGPQCLEIRSKRELCLVQISVSFFQLCFFGQLCSPVKPYLLEHCNLTKRKENNNIYMCVEESLF